MNDEQKPFLRYASHENNTPSQQGDTITGFAVPVQESIPQPVLSINQHSNDADSEVMSSSGDQTYSAGPGSLT